MNKIIFFFFLSLLWITISHPVFSQQKTSPVKPKKAATTKTISKTDPSKPVLSKEELEENKAKIGRMISFLEFALNIIGSDSSAAEDKEVIITNSYLKFFKDPKVQIEDDLDETRLVPTFKNVQSYLRDVDYFFLDAVFELNIDEITPYQSDKNTLYFVVGLTRYLKGVTNSGDTVKNSKKRFVEINLATKDKDLKIASIYSTRYNETEDLQNWWTNLGTGWKNVFRKSMGNSADTINYGQLKRILSTEDLNLSGDTSIRDLSPINKLTRLKTLDISSTNVTDLTPARNLTFLEVLNCSNTAVSSLDGLKYTTELKDLNISNTKINSIEPVVRFTKLEKLDLHQTAVNSLTPLSGLKNLKNLQIYATPVSDLTPLSSLTGLTILNAGQTEIAVIDPLSNQSMLTSLNISNTKITNLVPLKNCKSLKELLINNTQVSDLNPLKDIPALEKVYCDHAGLSKESAKAFMASKPGTLVIFESENMLQWWDKLDPSWKTIFQKYVPVGPSPTMEQLAAIANLSAIDISGNKDISSLQPLSAISNLKVLQMNATSINDLSALKEQPGLEVAEFSNTQVNDLSSLDQLKNLTRINCDNTPLENSKIENFKNDHPGCLVVFKTSVLNRWWAGVPDEWRQVFRKHLKMEDLPTSIELHQLVRVDSLGVSGNSSVKELEPLREFEQLKILFITNTSIFSLEPISKLTSLTKVSIPKNPIKNLLPISTLNNLEYLNIENTGVEDLEPLKSLAKLKFFDCAGTPVDDLKYLEQNLQLTFLDCSSTSVGNLKALDNIENLQFLKCFNTKLSSKKIEKFKKTHPVCNVVYY